MRNLYLPALLAALSAISLPAQKIGNCPVFPSNNIWNTPVDQRPLDKNSTAYVNAIGAAKKGHADFGSGTWNGAPIGIPFTTVTAGQAPVPVTFTYADESDPGPYPIPPNPPIEGGPSSTGDRHVLVIDTSACKLYELFSAYPQTNGSWQAGSGAVFNLGSNALRPAGWTSADAAGLPVFPGLVRYDEVASGAINHALRFTAPKTRKAYVWPGRHYASSIVDPGYPPMGQRFRLRAGFDITPFPADIQVILKAMKKYGMFLADNGSPWFVSGAPDPRWNNDHLAMLSRLLGTDFEAVDESGLMVNVNSGQAGASTQPPPPPPCSNCAVNYQNGVSGYTGTQAHTISDLYASQSWNGGKGSTDPAGTTLYLSGLTPASGGYSARGLLKFTGLTAPAGKKVQSASLTLELNAWSNSAIAAYYLTTPWDGLTPTTVSWSNATKATKWATPGGDHSTGLAFTLNAKAVGNQQVTTPLDATVVQNWIDNPVANQGLLLVETGATTTRVMGVDASPATQRPQLTIVFN